MAAMAARARLRTPPVIVRHGWRDIPYQGKDRCPECFGWGCRSALVGQACEVFHRTCPTCRGRGRT
jgi:DnaJ-class molecular chaperone